MEIPNIDPQQKIEIIKVHPMVRNKTMTYVTPI